MEREQAFQVIQGHTSALKPRQLKLWTLSCSSAMEKQGLPAAAHLKALLKKGSRSNSANMLLAKTPRPNILTTRQTIPDYFAKAQEYKSNLQHLTDAQVLLAVLELCHIVSLP